MLAAQGDVCWLCGHPGGFEADHIVPISLAPDQPIDPDLLRPSHGSNYPCPTCGRRCNQERSNKVNFIAFRPSITW